MSGTADIMRVRRAAVAHLIAGVAEVRAGKLGAARERLAAQRTLDNSADRRPTIFPSETAGHGLRWRAAISREPPTCIAG